MRHMVLVSMKERGLVRLQVIEGKTLAGVSPR